MSEVMRTTPFIDLYSPGEKMVYDLLNVTFIVDEDIQTWLEIHKDRKSTRLNSSHT